MLGLLYSDDSEEDLRVIIGRFVEVCERRGPKVSVIEEGVDVSRRESHEGELEHISVFKY